MSAALPPILVGLFGAGIALSFYLADRDSPSTRAFALALGMLAITVGSTPMRGVGITEAPEIWDRVTALLETAILAAGCEWLYRIAQTIAPSSPGRSRSSRLLRAAQACAAVYGLGGVLFLEARLRYSGGAWTAAAVLDPTFWLLFGPSLLALVLLGSGAWVVARSDVDAAERLRLRAAVAATPFLFSGVPMQPPWEYPTTAIGEILFLGGSVQYYVIQGRRGQFLGRFLSPQVAKLVRERGLAAAMEHRRSDLSVVAFDLRGFTPYAESEAPEKVMAVVQAYYEAIGEVVTHCSGTVKDFAGDGVLCLVGAPIAQPDHARRALVLAITGRDRAAEVLHAATGTALGIGVGVASGPVTVGAIGGEARLEYAAVGPAVNLASRLCAQASAGEVIADAHTIALAGDDGVGGFRPAGSLELKGIARPVSVYRESSRDSA
ncbi:MAG: adenylate/guanylate cyclase domain-containing protein [Deltaproteobacteria bacterium]|nr:adenylate/guanylate cyclase domain-containing protein [Deltaproteobacteria bacterium]